MADLNLSGGVAVVTGAAGGIGRALAQHAAQRWQMQVVLADNDEQALAATAGDLKAAGYKVLAVPTDVRDPAALDELAATTRASCGAVRLLINNAGLETLGFSWEIPAAQWERALQVNVHGVIHGVRAFVPDMIAHGQPCAIANLSSLAGVSIAPLQASYVMSKHAVLAYSECLSLELAMKGVPVQVSAVLPGPVNTGIFEVLQEATDPAVAAHHQEMKQLLSEHGMSPGDAAATILEQLAAGEFWISTHPEITRAMAQQRADTLSHLRTPNLDNESAFDI